MLVLFFNKDRKSIDQALDENVIFCFPEEKVKKQTIKTHESNT